MEKATEKFDPYFFNIRHNFDVASSQKKSGTRYQLHMLGVTLQENFSKVMESEKPSVNMQLAAVLRDHTEKMFEY